MLGGLFKGNASNKMLSFLRVRQLIVTRDGIMEKKIVYLKLLQFVLTLAFIWRLRSLHQICGTFADPKAFLHDISIGHCKSFTLIGNDTKSGEFVAVFDHHKWHNQMSMSSTNGRPIEEQQHHQFIDELAAKLPSAGRFCIPITITPSDWFYDAIGMNRNPLKKFILFFFCTQLLFAFLSLGAFGLSIMAMLRSVEEYKVFWAALLAFYSITYWYLCAAASFNMLFNWTDFWTCFNFRADRTIVQFDTLVLSIVMVYLYAFEIFLQDVE